MARSSLWFKYDTNIFSVPVNFETGYITGQWGEFIKRISHNAFISFLVVFCVFVIVKFVFLSFLFVFFFDEVPSFRNRMLTN